MRQFLSPYLYCANNPVNCIDPSGLFSFAPQDTSETGFGGGTDMWGRERFDSFRGLYIPYADRPGGVSLEGYGNSEYGKFATWYTISSGYNYLKENFGMKETYIFWMTVRRDGQEFTWYSNPWDRYTQGTKPLSEMSEHERTMANPIVQQIHQAQWDFLRGTVELTASGLQRIGSSLATVGYAATATGPGAEAGVPLVSIGNMLQYTGLGIEALLDWKEGKSRELGYSVATNSVIGGIGYIGSHYAPGPAGAIFNLTLIPFNEVLNHAGETIPKPNTKK